MLIEIIDPVDNTPRHYVWNTQDDIDDYSAALGAIIANPHSDWEAGWEGETWGELRDRHLAEEGIIPTVPVGVQTVFTWKADEDYRKYIDFRVAIKQTIRERIKQNTPER